MSQQWGNDLATVNKNAKSVDINKQDVNSMADGLDKRHTELTNQILDVIDEGNSSRYEVALRLTEFITQRENTGAIEELENTIRKAIDHNGTARSISVAKLFAAINTMRGEESE